MYIPLGMQAYHGLIQHIRDPTERKSKSDEICAKVSSLRHLLSQKGFEVPVVREKQNAQKCPPSATSSRKRDSRYIYRLSPDLLPERVLSRDLLLYCLLSRHLLLES
jgi:hypothetical protein